MTTYRALQVRDCQGTLWALFREYEGRALASFEGDLQVLHMQDLPGSSSEQTAALRRQTSSSEFDFMVVPITRENVAALKARLSAPAILGRDGSIIHVQIEVDKELIFLACDNFHDECTAASVSVPEHFLARLKATGLLRGYGDA